MELAKVLSGWQRTWERASLGGEVESGKGYGKMRGSRFWVEEGGRRRRVGMAGTVCGERWLCLLGVSLAAAICLAGQVSMSESSWRPNPTCG